MSRKNTWKNIGIVRALKYTSLVLFIMFLIAFSVQMFLYFNPVYENYSSYLSDNRYVQQAAENAINAEKGGHIYSAFWCLVWAAVSFLFFWYYKKKLIDVCDIAKKESKQQNVLHDVIKINKERDKILEVVSQAKTKEDFDELQAVVDKYNDLAEKFYEIHGVQPKLITYSDFDARRDAVVPKTFDEEMDEKFPLIPKTHGEWTVRFRYRNMLCILKENESDILNTLKNCIGYEVTFIPEPDNEFDDKAIAVHFGGKKVGYIYKNDDAQRMVHTWIKLNRHLCGYISRYDEAEGRIYYDIGFYKND